MIAIQTNKDMIFNSSKGKIRMEIDLISNRPSEKVYEMRIIDSVNKDFEEEQQIPIIDDLGNITFETKIVIINKTLEEKAPRFKIMTYDELRQLVEVLNVDVSQGDIMDNFHFLFRKGLLIVTQQECLAGISGEPNKGMYFTEAQDWEIYGEKSKIEKLN